MRRALTAAAFALPIALALAAAPAGAQQAEAPSARIVVQGIGEAAAQPDMARATFGATVEGSQAESAAAEASARMARVIAALEAAGVAQADMRTVAIDLSPVHERGDGPPRLAGWRASQSLEVVLRDVGALGPVIDAAVTAGATDIRQVAFDLTDRTALRDAARRAAVADARAAADLLAEAAGVTLGRLVELSLGGGDWGGPRPMRAVMMEADTGTPVAPGMLSVSASVSAVYAVE